MKFWKRHIRTWMNLWPPFAGAGIRVKHIASDWSAVDVEMKLRFWNSNYVGTHYGGSLYSMTDPFYMLMLIEKLGREYTVWDKSAAIRFRRPGRGRVTAHFRISQEQVDGIREAVTSQGKTEATFTVEVKDEGTEVVAIVDKVLHIRRNNQLRGPTSQSSLP